MHIPFTRDKGTNEGNHTINLVDHTAHETTLGTIDEVEDPSPAPEPEHQLPILERPAISSGHAIELPSGLVDVLYENQRGAFLCGIPLFSAAGLWITDPHAWTSIDHKFTPFTIFNATTPDPTWEWVWKRWFVDMSGDVDENGWTYNINFTKHHWHGHHIWYHSFVRRRRWLRKRRKIVSSSRNAAKQRNPAEDYATIYSSLYRSPSRTQERQSHINGVVANGNEDDDDEIRDEDFKLENIGDFYVRLRQARLDREKLDAVDNFLRNGRDLGALAGEMGHILRFMIFQESRRQLLTLLATRCQELERGHEASSSAPSSISASEIATDSNLEAHHQPQHQCVRDAIEMADFLVNKLDYFSDRQKVTRAEEDAEMSRIVSCRLSAARRCGDTTTGRLDRTTTSVEGHAARSVEEEEKEEGRDHFTAPSLDETLAQVVRRQQQQSTRPALSHADGSRRKVSFVIDEPMSKDRQQDDQKKKQRQGQEDQRTRQKINDHDDGDEEIRAVEPDPYDETGATRPSGTPHLTRAEKGKGKEL